MPLLALSLAFTAVVFGSAAPASAAAVTINLCAVPGSFDPLPTTNPSLSIPIWGFATTTTPGVCTAAAPTLPGPQLTVTEGDSVTLSVTNALPAGHSITLEADGIDFAPGADSAAPGAVVTRTFTASAAGTYLYESGGDAGLQEAMGLYGALLVRPAVAGRAYDAANSNYDRESVLVLSAVDPAYNAAAAPVAHNYAATYWLINGRSYPDTAAVLGSPGQRVLLRYLNAGYDNTTMSLLGAREWVYARDSRPLNNPFDAVAETFPAGATEDTFVTVPAGAAPSQFGFPLFNRQLHLTNGTQMATSPTPVTGGGMLTFLHP
ncbi:multicopper oxidase domain-containing protein [Jatrophihabitans telluris]|uniref:Multicopper oxidase domain-containing protein n=1 Tax=Jatrophihabitans telluris TaxID=2038343 RepID=A0ABY4R0E9_9ACTN|nr:multicopper oxidase domain-containing protein [Jatrophihabitans telluris]UQX88812.1 multicopper oxidase domain-containing protein [Jatrophihabitans telluris]